MPDWIDKHIQDPNSVDLQMGRNRIDVEYLMESHSTRYLRNKQNKYQMCQLFNFGKIKVQSIHL